jgi:tRNA threonylcarbamoyladenosine biosynthesis protein TsaB
VRALGIETATSIASVGVVVEDRVVAERALPICGSHARTLLPLIDEALATAGIALDELDLLAVSIGPGSFTGLRIGLSVAKGLALATELPVIGVPTLDAYAHAAGVRPGILCPVLDARKGEVYAAAFRWCGADLECVAAAAAMTPARLAAMVRPPCTLVGDGVDAYADLWRRELGDAVELIPLSALPPSGAMVARLGLERFLTGGADDLALLEPCYCRQSEAELSRDRSASAVRPGAPPARAW